MKIPSTFQKRLIRLEGVAAKTKKEHEDARSKAGAELLSRVFRILSRQENDVVHGWLKQLEGEKGRESFALRELELYDSAVYEAVKNAVERLNLEMVPEGWSESATGDLAESKG